MPTTSVTNVRTPHEVRPFQANGSIDVVTLGAGTTPGPSATKRASCTTPVLLPTPSPTDTERMTLSALQRDEDVVHHPRGPK